MKTANRICQILSIIFATVSLVLFFFNFAEFTVSNGGASAPGTVIGFGGKLSIAGNEASMARSADILFCFWLTVIGLVLSIFSFKSKKVRYFAPAVGLGTGIYVLVMAVSKAVNFVDARPLTYHYRGAVSVEYASLFGNVPTILLTAIALFLFAIAAAAYLFIDDYIEVMESKGSKRTIMQRVIGFFKDYKSEIKKIVWPGPRDVVKNTTIVIVMCLIVGAFIWILDWGLAELINLILKKG